MACNIVKFFKTRFGTQKRYYRIIDDIFGLCPHNIELYKLALVHRSASVTFPDGTVVNNERLEFLGDAILESVVSDYLFIEYPDAHEGELTQLRSKLVNRQTLNKLCTDIGLAQHIISNTNGNFTQKHITGDALEAMIGAIYLDKGYNFVNRLIISKLISRHIDQDELESVETDYKSRLIEWCQKNKHTIRFATGYDEKSNGAAPLFRSVAMIDEMDMGYGLGTSKKEAEQRASYAVSQALSENNGDFLLEWVDRHMNNTSDHES